MSVLIIVMLFSMSLISWLSARERRTEGFSVLMILFAFLGPLAIGLGAALIVEKEIALGVIMVTVSLIGLASAFSERIGEVAMCVSSAMIFPGMLLLIAG